MLACQNWRKLTCCMLRTGDRQTFSQSPCSSTNPYTFSGTPVAMTPMGAPSMKINKEPLNSGTRMIPTLVPICGEREREREREVRYNDFVALLRHEIVQLTTTSLRLYLWKDWTVSPLMTIDSDIIIHVLLSIRFIECWEFTAQISDGLCVCVCMCLYKSHNYWSYDNQVLRAPSSHNFFLSKCWTTRLMTSVCVTACVCTMAL